VLKGIIDSIVVHSRKASYISLKAPLARLRYRTHFHMEGRLLAIIDKPHRMAACLQSKNPKPGWQLWLLGRRPCTWIWPWRNQWLACGRNSGIAASVSNSLEQKPLLSICTRHWAL